MHNLKYIYILVFSSLAGWAIFAYLTTTQIINSQQMYASMINIAGTQRMLSQKIALISKRYYESKEQGLKTHLISLRNDMKSNHEHIINNYIHSARALSIYKKSPKHLENKVNIYLDQVKSFIENEDLSTLYKLEALSFTLLPLLNEAVNVFEDESEQKNQLLLERELFILVGTLITLFLEAIFIVLPAIRYASLHEHELNELVKERTQELKKLSITDPLTQLFNRRKTDDVLRHELERAKRNEASFSVILLDIDLFKNINDTFGHQVGDKVLQEISEILKLNVRKIDTVGRWGGEEFFIINTEIQTTKVLNFAEKIRLLIEEYNFNEVGQVTCSFGIAHYLDNDDEESIIKRCDKALYLAKDSGRNCIKEVLI